MVNRSYEEPIRQPVIPGDRPPLNSGAQLLKRKRLAQTGEQTSEENSESDPESDETDDETEENEEPSGTADKEEAVDSESNQEDEGQAAETDVTSENTPDSEAKESD